MVKSVVSAYIVLATLFVFVLGIVVGLFLAAEIDRNQDGTKKFDL